MNKSKHAVNLKSKIDSRLERIANILFLNSSSTANLGLINGKMGIAIFFYHYYRITKNEMFSEYADELIDRIYNEISIKTPINFEDGLAGVGWGIEYLIKNRFVAEDTDDSLTELDDIIYKSQSESLELFSDDNRFLSYSMYHLSRINRNGILEDNHSMLKRRRYINRLIDACEKIFIQRQPLNSNIFEVHIKIFNSIVWFLFELRKSGLYPVKVGRLLKLLFSDTGMINQQTGKWVDRLIFWQILQYNYSNVNEALFEEKYKTLKSEQNLEVESIQNNDSIINDFIVLSWNKLIYFPHLNDDPYISVIKKRVFNIIDNEENWGLIIDKLNWNNLGLSGLSGLSLGLMNE